MRTLKLGIVCGCLPRQYGIAPQDLYHQVLAQKIRSSLKLELDVHSVWYTTLAESAAKTKKLLDEAGPQLLIYHVRPDPFLRASKLLVKYTDSEGARRSMLNFAANDSCIVDRDDYDQRQRPKRPKLKSFFRSLNYLGGFMLGTYKKASERELRIIQEVEILCQEKKIPLLVVGPASRPTSLTENAWLSRLEKRMSGQLRHLHYISCFGTHNEKGATLFMEDNVHLNRDGHHRIARLISDKLEAARLIA